MKKLDVIVIGSGPCAIEIANSAVEKKKSVGLISHLPTYDTAFQSMIKTWAEGSSGLIQAPTPHEAISVIQGPAQFLSPTSVQSPEGSFETKKFVLATGITPRNPFDHPESMNQVCFPWDQGTQPPSTSAVIIGAGPLGVGLASFLHRQKVSVTIITRGDSLLSKEEPDIGRMAQHNLEARGITILTKSNVYDVIPINGHQKKILYTVHSEKKEISSEKVYCAAGIKPNIDGLNLKAADVYVHPQGHVVTMEDMKASSGYLWAAGGVRIHPYHLDRERFETQIISHNLFEFYINLMRMDWEPLPFHAPLGPDFSSVGLKEKEALAQHRDARAISLEFPIHALDSTLGAQEKGLIKIVARHRSGKILGAHIYSPRAAEMLAYINLAIRADISLRELLDRQFYSSFTGMNFVWEALRKWDT